MQDNLEQYIKDHREDFDTERPGKGVWRRIEGSLDQINPEINRTPGTGWFWKAAVVLLLGAVTFLLADRYTFKTQEAGSMTTVEEFRDLEMFYSSLISKKQVKIQEVLGDDAQFFDYLEAEVEELDAIYKELKRNFEENQETTEMRDALIRLLRQRLHLISSQLDLLNEEAYQQANREEGVRSL